MKLFFGIILIFFFFFFNSNFNINNNLLLILKFNIKSLLTVPKYITKLHILFLFFIY